jgi:hypothetical protein
MLNRAYSESPLASLLGFHVSGDAHGKSEMCCERLVTGNED